MEELLRIATRHHLLLIEDACQAHGATYKGKRVGGLGDAGCFSFFPGKNLGAFGDGGMVVTNDHALAEKIRMLRNYGQHAKYNHVFLAYNRRLDNLQAAVLRIKLRHLDGWNKARQETAKVYDYLLRSVANLQIPFSAPDRSHVYHLYVIQHAYRDGLMSHLQRAAVSTGIHYPIPVHLQPCYGTLGVRRGSLPVTESLAPRVISLPMFPEMSNEQVEYVVSAIANFQKTKKQRFAIPDLG
jgi:dTDP-4-amino-4,6-dideoxygalactose transaminase